MKRTSFTSGQEEQWLRSLADAARRGGKLALKKAELDKDSFQRLLGRGNQLKTALAELIVAKTRELSVSDKFADEEVKSSYGYPSGYKLKGLTEQTNILRQLFPGIGYSNLDLHERAATGKLVLPANAEGWFAIPRWEKFAPTYGEAVQAVLAKLGSTRKFYNYRNDQLGSDRLRQNERTVKMFQTLGDQQKGDIVIVPAQFGLLHRGRSVRRAREVFKTNEFGLDSFAIACLLLTHPERLVQWKQLHIDCVGDDYAPDAGGRFGSAPYFFFLFLYYGDGVKFGAGWVGRAGGSFGSVSAFLPQ